RTPSSARPRRLAIVESEKKRSDDSRTALVFRFVGLVRNRARTIGPVDERRHFDAACDLCVMYKTQGGHRVDMQQLIELRMQPACLLVEQRGGCVGLGAQHREINLGVRVVRRQLDAGQGDQAGPRYIQLALDEAGQVFLDLVGQPQVAAGDGFGLVTTHERPGNAAPYRERAISLISKTSSWSPTWMSLLPRSVRPQSKPDLTSLTSSLKRRSES